MKENLMKRIIVDQKVMVGKPIIRGTRVPVYAIVKRFAQGWTIEEILEDYPKLTKKDVYAALEYSAEIAKNEEIIPIMVE